MSDNELQGEREPKRPAIIHVMTEKEKKQYIKSIEESAKRQRDYWNTPYKFMFPKPVAKDYTDVKEEPSQVMIMDNEDGVPAFLRYNEGFKPVDKAKSLRHVNRLHWKPRKGLSDDWLGKVEE